MKITHFHYRVSKPESRANMKMEIMVAHCRYVADGEGRFMWIHIPRWLLVDKGFDVRQYLKQMVARYHETMQPRIEREENLVNSFLAH